MVIRKYYESCLKTLKLYRFDSPQGGLYKQFESYHIDTTQYKIFEKFKYYDANRLPENYEKAIKLFRLAAEQGDADAQLSLGGMYREGKGVKQDYSEAETWYQKAVDQGREDALFYLHNHKGMLQKTIPFKTIEHLNLYQFSRLVREIPHISFDNEAINFYAQCEPRVKYPFPIESDFSLLSFSNLLKEKVIAGQYALGGAGDYYFGPSAAFLFTLRYNKFLSLHDEPHRTSLMFFWILMGPIYNKLNLKIHTFCFSPSRVDLKNPYFNYKSVKCIGEMFVKYYKNLRNVDFSRFGELTPEGAATFRQFIPYMKNIRKFEVGGTDLVHDTQFDHLIPEVLIDEEFLKSL